MMRSDFRVRGATDEDVPGIVEVWKHFMDFHRHLDPHLQRADDGGDHFAAFLRAQLAADDARLWVGEHHLTVVGYCLVRLGQRPPVFEDRAYAEIVDLAVEQPYRRRGIGTALVTEAQGWFERRGIRRVELRVSAYNEGGLAFWRKLGFRSYLEVMYRDDPQRSDCNGTLGRTNPAS